MTSPVQVHIRYVTGQVRATPWNVARNSGETEWPPAPWRLARAALAMWHLRRPHLDSAAVERVVRVLASPPEYRTPPAAESQTRHYMPQSTRRSDGGGGTALSLEPMRTIDPDSPVVVHWGSTGLCAEDVAVLRELVGALTYLGRSESAVSARLVLPEDTDWVTPHEDGEWWAPGAGGTHTLLCGDEGVTRAELEVDPTTMRNKDKVLHPQGARWIPYVREGSQVLGGKAPAVVLEQQVTAVRWRLHSVPAMRAVSGVLATEGLRRAALGAALGPERELLLAGGPDAQRARELLRGKRVDDQPMRDHLHASWWWMAEPLAGGVPGEGVLPPRAAQVRDVVLWMPTGLPLVGGRGGRSILSSLAGLTRTAAESEHAPTGYVQAQAQVVAVGPVAQVAPELVGASATWRTYTPYLPTRHRKAGRDDDLEAFLLADLRREIDYRSAVWEALGTPAPVPVAVTVHAGPSEQEAVRSYRRYRWSERMGRRRDGFDLTVSLEAPCAGPLSLGALSHFGMGQLRPVV